ncbi:DUF2939 domain-containing protein [Oxalobacteraceae bacterium OM1]|nr:DUF2939 domain-containing protein [Oxalobacteraceae bacterium OM1]
MKRSIAIGAGACAAAALVAGMAVSPYVAAQRIEEAIAARDGDALAAHVDFAALRASTKAGLLDAIRHGGPPADGRIHPFAEAGQMLAGAVIGPIVDNIVTPAGVSVMLMTGHLPAVGLRRQPDTGAVIRPHFDVAYRDWRHVALTPVVDDPHPVRFIMRREGLFGWQVDAIELDPEDR